MVDDINSVMKKRGARQQEIDVLYVWYNRGLFTCYLLSVKTFDKATRSWSNGYHCCHRLKSQLWTKSKVKTTACQMCHLKWSKKRKLQRSRRSDKKWRLNHLMERQINKERVFGNRRHRFYSWWWTDEGEEEWEEEEDDGQTIITTIRRRKKKVCSLGFKQEQFIQGISRDWFSTFVLGGRSTSTPNRKFMFHYCFYCGQWAWYLHSGKNLAT